jgi:hypothetical protein
VYSIGRDPRCDIRLFSQFVSRRHATLVRLPREDGSSFYRIVDGDAKGKPSANGLQLMLVKSQPTISETKMRLSLVLKYALFIIC